MRKIQFTVVAAAILMVACVLPSYAESGEQGTDPNRSAADAKEPKADDFVHLSHLADELAVWGRENSNPAAVAMAARILASAGEKPMEDTPTKESKHENGTPSNEPPKEPRHVGPEELLAEARTMAASDAKALEAIEAIAAMGVKSRGNENGPAYHCDTVNAGDVDLYVIRFTARELAEVAVVGDGSTDLDLIIFDENKNVIGGDAGSSDRCYYRWVPKWTGAFVIAIKNHGSVSNRYTLRTN